MKKFENLKSFENSLKGVKTTGELFELLRDAGAELWRAPYTSLCKRSETDVFLRNVGENGAYVDLPQIKFVRKRGVPNYLDYTPDEMEVRNLRIHPYAITDGYENSDDSSDEDEDEDIPVFSNDDWEWESSLPYQDESDRFVDPDGNYDSWERGYDY